MKSRPLLKRRNSLEFIPPDGFKEMTGDFKLAAGDEIHRFNKYSGKWDFYTVCYGWDGWQITDLASEFEAPIKAARKIKN